MCSCVQLYIALLALGACRRSVVEERGGIQMGAIWKHITHGGGCGCGCGVERGTSGERNQAQQECSTSRITSHRFVQVRHRNHSVWHARVPVFMKCEQYCYKQFCAPFALPSSRVRVDLLGRVDRKQEERERGRGREEEGHRHLQCLALHLAAQRPQVAHRCRTYHPRQARQTLAV